MSERVRTRPLLEVRGLRAGYGGIEVLHGIDLEVPGGALVALLGPNGAGKTTTLRVISGLLRATAGSVLIEGHDVGGADAHALARAGVCLIPEGRGLFPNLTVRENILMDTFATRRKARELEQTTFERFPQLADRRDQLAGTLSGGEQQMLALARALTTEPALILLDELSMGLAPLIVDRLYAVVHELTSTGVTILVVEQMAGLVLDAADHAIVLAQGRVKVSGAPDVVRPALASAYLGELKR